MVNNLDCIKIYYAYVEHFERLYIEINLRVVNNSNIAIEKLSRLPLSKNILEENIIIIRKNQNFYISTYKQLAEIKKEELFAAIKEGREDHLMGTLSEISKFTDNSIINAQSLEERLMLEIAVIENEFKPTINKPLNTTEHLQIYDCYIPLVLPTRNILEIDKTLGPKIPNK